MTTLAAFQDGFARALLATDVQPDLPPAVARLAAQPGFAVYRNTVIKACVDAIEANFPAVARLVGSEWMRAAAAVFAGRNLPAQPMLLDYGAGFPDFLAGFEPAADLPYLPAVARLDRLWIEAHTAADAPVLHAEALAAIAPRALQRAWLVLHPAARWGWFAEAPAWTIWSRNRIDESGAAASHTTHIDEPIDWRAEGALLTRPGFEVMHCAADRGAIAFLDACAAAGTVEAAALAALGADSDADLAALVCRLIGAGAFAGLRAAPHSDLPFPSAEDIVQ